jgi:hypothetical protein
MVKQTGVTGFSALAVVILTISGIGLHHHHGRIALCLFLFEAESAHHARASSFRQSVYRHGRLWCRLYRALGGEKAVGCKDESTAGNGPVGRGEQCRQDGTASLLHELEPH